MRLAKYLAHAGVASRRAAEDIVRSGRVAVEGEVVTDPAWTVTDASDVKLDGRRLGGPEPRVVYALHKPAGVVSTVRDTHGRPTVVQLIGRRGEPNRRARLYPVGRLDADTTGLILVTNDGELANALLHPSRGVERAYRARLGGGGVGEAALRALRRGVELDDGRTAPARVRRLADDLIELVIHEGRKRQVRRMCEAVGHPVLELQRTRFGPLRLGRLGPGESRRLTDAEVAALRAAARPRR
jgi:23S rRNA pseudouridine2605 synthase